jgi:hypothetical protein
MHGIIYKPKDKHKDLKQVKGKRMASRNWISDILTSWNGHENWRGWSVNGCQ